MKYRVLTSYARDPLRLSNFLLSECLSRGVHLHASTHTLSVSCNSSGQIRGIRIHTNGTEADLPCSRLVITSGAWTPQVFTTLFPSSDVKLPITSLAGHSLLMRSPAWKRPQEGEETAAVFSTDPTGYFPEIFARIDGGCPFPEPHHHKPAIFPYTTRYLEVMYDGRY